MTTACPFWGGCGCPASFWDCRLPPERSQQTTCSPPGCSGAMRGANLSRHCLAGPRAARVPCPADRLWVHGSRPKGARGQGTRPASWASRALLWVRRLRAGLDPEPEGLGVQQAALFFADAVPCVGGRPPAGRASAGHGIRATLGHALRAMRSCAVIAARPTIQRRQRVIAGVGTQSKTPAGRWALVGCARRGLQLHLGTAYLRSEKARMAAPP